MIVSNNKTYTSPLRPNFKASLLNVMQQKYTPVQTAPVQHPSPQAQAPQAPVYNPAFVPVSTPTADAYVKQAGKSSLLIAMMTAMAAKPAPQTIQTQPTTETTVTAPVQAVQPPVSAPLLNYKNNLRSMFQNNQAVIYAMIPRTFNAKDTDGNGLIEGNEEPGYFTNMIERLDELKSYGINTLHWLPINPPGNIAAKGNAGSVYAPADYLLIDPMLDDPKNPKSVYDEAKDAITECHRKDIRVMVDLPSCMSVDLYDARPDLRATGADGKPKTPEGWEDIRMFNPWQDPDKRILNPALMDYHKKFIDMCIDLKIDGIRADVGRAKPPEFWDELIAYTRRKDPEFAFLAECYTYEDASPMKNMPADRPREALDAGFDSYYGQYHIFNIWKGKDFHQFIKENLDMTNEKDSKGNLLLRPGKSLIGSFATHDDKSPMSNGGPDYCMMTNVVQTTLPMTNPYIVTGFESGDRYLYPYGMKLINKTFSQLLENQVYRDITSQLLNTTEVSDNLAELLKSDDKNKTVEELSKSEKYSKVMNVLNDFYMTGKDLEDKSKTIAQIQKDTDFNTGAYYLLEIAKNCRNLKNLVSSGDKNKKISDLADSEYKDIINYFKTNPLTKDNIVYYISPEHVDIFNKSRKPGGENPEIGHHFGYMMNSVRPKYGELITKGSYIELPVKNNSRDEVIAYARCKDGQTLVTIVNHDVNARQKVQVQIPGLKPSQKLEDLSPKYGTGSEWQAKKDMIEIDLGPAQAHIFEVDTPDLPASFDKEKVLTQNLGQN